MKGSLQKTLVCALSTLFVLAPISQVARAGGGGVLRRLAANTRGYTPGTEISTILGPFTDTPAADGVVIFDRSIYVPRDINVLFITISATADTHHGARLLVSCLVDDVACNPGKLSNGAPAGWVPVQRHKNYNLNYATSGTAFNGDGQGGAGDLHDNSIYATWCKEIPKKPKHHDDDDDDDGAPHNIKIKFGAREVEHTDPPPPVFMEAVNFIVDGARLRGMNACKSLD